jgi:hypothetical protein
MNDLPVLLSDASLALGELLITKQTYRPGEVRARLVARIEREPELRPLIDRACEYYIAHATWLLPNPELLWFCQDRLREGKELAIELLQNPVPSLPVETKAALRYLLVDRWPDFGLPRWRARLAWL